MYFPLRLLPFIATALLMLVSSGTAADEIRVAVASNFAHTLKAVASNFETASGHQVKISIGSTGKHYAQIHHGAPFDAFFAADSKRPALLEAKGAALPGSRFTYALGKLVLWSPKAGYVDAQGKVLETGDFQHLAIANPRLAPYGRAAQEVLQKRGLWETLKGRAVRGENIAQTFQFVKSGNAGLGFVAWSQIKRPGQAVSGSWWEIPANLYAPIEQQAVLLNDSRAAQEFVRFVQNEESRQLIRSFGYDLP
ncbi:molybdate ABC transporter substrate-binding protein [Thiolapillus sp.]